uniref:Surface antigen (D15) n=1 Tax=Cyanothece sp. (strain PCC 7425 / ATCC 29141) TaxID=395961 RepID=B8HQD5_CYAP4
MQQPDRVVLYTFLYILAGTTGQLLPIAALAQPLPSVPPDRPAAPPTAIQPTPIALPSATQTVTLLTPQELSSQEQVSTQARDLWSEHPLESSQPALHLGQTQTNPPSPDPTAEEEELRRYSRLYFGSRLPEPTVLPGPTRSPIVQAGDNVRGGIDLQVGGQYSFWGEHRLGAELRGGQSVLGAELNYFRGSTNPERGLEVNVFNLQSYSPSFQGGDRDVDLPDGNNPIVDRLGAGVEILRPLLPRLALAVGASYQAVAVREGFFSSSLEPVDELGNKLTVSDTGRDDLWLLSAALQYDTRDNSSDPTRGTRLRFGLDQSLPLGSGTITMTRFSASATQFIPVKGFGFTQGPRTLVFSLQGGHILGDVPPYEAFNLGGQDTVRGFDRGGVGTGSSFIQATAEYRFPLVGFRLIGRRIDVGAVFFADYGSTLGSQSAVIGQPGVVRDKPGDGFGGGLGVRIKTGLGISRLEVGFGSQGEVLVYFGLGERF